MKIFAFRWLIPGLLLGGTGFGRPAWSVLKFGREASFTALCLCFCTLHTNAIPRTDPLVQIDYARVVDLDIGASKSDKLRDQSGHHFGARRQNSSLQPRVGR